MQDRTAHTGAQMHRLNWYFNLSLKAKFILVTSALVIAICGSMYFFIDRIFRAYLRSEIAAGASDIAASLHDQLVNFIDPSQVQVSADHLLKERPEISRIVVYQRVGNVLVQFLESSSSDLPPQNTDLYTTAIHRRLPFGRDFKHDQKEYWEFAYPILSNGSVAGLTTITFNFSQYKVFMSAVRRDTLFILVLALIVMLLSMNVYVEMNIRRPIAQIVNGMEEVKRSVFDLRLTPRSRDEIGKLTDDFNEMVAALGEAQDEIMRQNRVLEKRVQEATSELRSRNIELFEVQDELRRASRLSTAGQVAAMLAHDLGSPLSSISGHLQLMLEDPGRKEEEKERISLVLAQVERLSDTIRGFLNDLKTPTARMEQCNLNDLLEHLFRLTAPLFTERKISPTLDTDDHLPEINADRNQLQQLFLNLFTNAIDAMKEGGELRVRTEHLPEGSQGRQSAVREFGGGRNNKQGGGLALVTVEDTGPGMKAEHLKHIFRPFFSTKEFGKGTGLGLAICREIVRAHGGEILVDSQEGKGVKFRIYFPLELQEPVSVADGGSGGDSPTILVPADGPAR